MHELCPTSNFQTKAVPDDTSYPFALFPERGLKVTINTDNRTVSHTTLTDELIWTADEAAKQKLRQELGAYDAGSRKYQ